jgi:hypothetical protein
MTALAPNPLSPNKPTSAYPKQAVVVIHGMGEQRPMDTLRGFVRTVWELVQDHNNGLRNRRGVGAGQIYTSSRVAANYDAKHPDGQLPEWLRSISTVILSRPLAR